MLANSSYAFGFTFYKNSNLLKLIIYIIYSNETDADILYFGSLTNTPDTNSQNSGLHFLTFSLGGS
jgi:hypothetical protein